MLRLVPTRLLCLSSFLFTVACSTTGAPIPDRPAEVLADEQPSALQLPGFARPLGYRAELELDPDADDFRGVIVVDLEVSKATRTLWLNSRDLSIESVSVGQAELHIAATAKQHSAEVLVLALAETLNPGRATVTLVYRGRYDDQRTEGIYRVKEADGTNHVYSMFEPQKARRAFPHFDDPQYKVPWTLSFVVREGHVAVANSPIAKTTKLDDGLQRISMLPSRPMPSYLVAFMAGPFEIVDAGTAGKHGTPLRFILPKGRSGELGYARAITPRIVALLEDYFGMKLPYRKLDIAVVPRYWGTMEHPGLLAMGQPLTLIKPEQDSPGRREAYANIAIHELCHYWFGDYVTMKWWDDAWLNEGLGTWCDATITQALEPSWRMDMMRVARAGAALHGDEAASAKTVRSPIARRQDIEAAFDGSTYNKGGAITRMFEMYVGRDRFRAAIRAYLAEHAWGSATTSSYLAVLNRELPGVGTAMASFLDQNGAPLVSFELTCSAGANPILGVKQEPVVPLGSSADKGRTWSFPVCVRYGTGADSERTCYLLTETHAQFPLDGTECPSWLIPNAGGSGYYRSRLASGLGEDAFKAALDRATAPEQVALASDLTALTRLGAIEVGDALRWIPELAKSKTYLLSRQALELAASIEVLVSDAQRPRYQHWLREQFGARTRALGWAPRDGESPDNAWLRRSLIRTVGYTGADATLRKQARAMARRYLKEPSSVHDSMVSTVLALATVQGDAALFDEILTRARSVKDRRVSAKLYAALGAFSEPVLIERALTVPLDHAVDLRDTRGIITAVARERRNAERVWRYLQANFSTLSTRMTEMYVRHYLVGSLSGLCDAKREPELRAFYKDRLDSFGGAQLELDNLLDDARTCSAWRDFHRSSARSFVDKLPRPR